MKNCISCSQAINDEAVFCPLCGTPQQQDAVQKAGVPITAGAFLRIFRPSFFGGFEEMNIKIDTRNKLIVNFLCLSRGITDDEINALNTAFDSMLYQPQEEYSLSRESHANYTLTNEVKILIENEKFRYNFISDYLLDSIKKETAENFFAIVWLLALLSVLDGQYSEEKSLLFSRIKNLFPISRKDVLHSIRAVLQKLIQKQYSSGRSWYLPGSILSSYVNDKDEIADDFKDIPEDFDFYACVEDTMQKLCVLETKIQQLEQSEGKYEDIKAQIEQLAAEERKLTNLLPGFIYQKF